MHLSASSCTFVHGRKPSSYTIFACTSSLVSHFRNVIASSGCLDAALTMNTSGPPVIYPLAPASPSISGKSKYPQSSPSLSSYAFRFCTSSYTMPAVPSCTIDSDISHVQEFTSVFTYPLSRSSFIISRAFAYPASVKSVFSRL